MCCCIPRGDVEMTVEADKGAYYCGETAQMHVQVDNRSSSDVSTRAESWGVFKTKLCFFQPPWQMNYQTKMSC